MTGLARGSAPAGTARARTSRSSRRRRLRRRSTCACRRTPAATARSASRCAVDQDIWTRRRARRRPGPALRLPRAAARSRPSAACASTPTGCSSDPYALRASSRSAATARARCTRSSSTSASTGATTARRTTPWSKTVLYETHVQGISTAASRGVRRSCAARTPGWPARRSSST